MSTSPGTPRTGPAQRAGTLSYKFLRVLVFVLPGLLLFFGSVRAQMGEPNLLLWLGTAFQILICCLTLQNQHGARQPIGSSIVTLYLIALGWVWLATLSSPNPTTRDWYYHFTVAMLLVVPVIIFALQTVFAGSTASVRRAYQLTQRLCGRRDWPANIADCRTLPEVKALRDALHYDAGPAIAILSDPRPQVRVAALAALEFRKSWKRGQQNHVLFQAHNAVEPAVRAAAITALANIDDRAVVEAVASFLRDPAPEVRKAATEALLWDIERRWVWVRAGVRETLADTSLQDEGALWPDCQLLPTEIVRDLTAWVAERGVISTRAAQTLGVHYARLVSERPSSEVISGLRDALVDPLTPSPLRLELGRVLTEANQVDHDTLSQLLEGSNPAPLRLLAADVLLQRGHHTESEATLRDIARVPNREIALVTAQILQRRMGVDMGLTLGEPLPPVLSQRAADVTRAVMLWATDQRDDDRSQPEISTRSSSAIRL